MAINTDAQALLLSDAEVKIDIGGLARGLGAGSDPEIGANEKTMNRNREPYLVLTWYSSLRVRVGTGTGAAPIVADVANWVP